MRGRSVMFESFGGVDLRSQVYDVDERQPVRARDARNCVKGRNQRGFRKRDGCTQFATATSLAFGLVAVDVAGPVAFLVDTAGSVLKRVNGAGVVTNIAPSADLGGVPAVWVRASASGGQGPYYGIHPVHPQQWDGNATMGAWTASSGAGGTGDFGIYHANRVWVVDAATSTLRWSDLEDPRAWPAANTVRLDPDDGMPLTGIGVVGEYLIVFKAHKAWIVYDLDIGANRMISAQIGCASHRSIVPTRAGTFFLSDAGVMVTNGESIRRVSDPVQPLLDGILWLQGGVLPPNFGAGAGVFFENRYMLGVPLSNSSTSDVLLEYDIDRDEWWIHDLPLYQPVVSRFFGGPPRLFAGRVGVQDIERIFDPGTTQDVGAPFTTYFKGPHHIAGESRLRKRVNEISIDGTGKLSVGLAGDFGSAEVDQGVVDMSGAGGDPTLGRVVNPGVARSLALDFHNATADPFEVESYTITYGRTYSD